MTQVKCDNCEWIGDGSETEEYRDFWSRADVGGEVPAGDCPKCGAFAYLVKSATVPPNSAARDWRLVLQDLVWAAEYDLRPLHQCGPSKSQAVANGNKLLADTATVPPADLLTALKRAIPWLAKAKAENVDAYCSMPGDLTTTIEQASAAIARAEADTSSVPPPSTRDISGDAEGSAYAARAQNLWACDVVEVDAQPKVSLAEDGAWVQSWVWVDAEEQPDPEPPYPCDTIKA